MVEHYLDTVGVSSSTLLVPTILVLNTKACTGFPFFNLPHPRVIITSVANRLKTALGLSGVDARVLNT